MDGKGDASLVEDNDDGMYYFLEFDPSGTYSVKISCGEILQKYQADAAVTSELERIFPAVGLVCKLKGDEFELSASPDRKPPNFIEFRRAVDAVFAVTKGADVELAKQVLQGDIEVGVINIGHLPLDEQVWQKREDILIDLYAKSGLQNKVPCVLFFLDRSITVVATPLVCLLMRELIVEYIYGCVDFDLLANNYVQDYKMYKDCPYHYSPSLRDKYLTRTYLDRLEAQTGIQNLKISDESMDST